MATYESCCIDALPIMAFGSILLVYLPNAHSATFWHVVSVFSGGWSVREKRSLPGFPSPLEHAHSIVTPLHVYRVYPLLT